MAPFLIFEHMRIGYDAKRYFFNNTGLGNYSRTLVEAVQQYPEAEITLYSPNAATSEFHVRYPKQSALWRTKRIVSDLELDDISIYHGLSNELPFGIHNSKVKSIVSIHDVIPKRYPNTFPLIDRLIYNAKLSYACKHADQILAISEATKQDIQYYFNAAPNRIQVVKQAINPIFLSEQNVSWNILHEQYGFEKEYAIYVGSINRRKNIERMIDAYLISNADFPLYIVGSGGKLRKELMQKYAVHSHIIWIDRLQDNLHLKSAYQYSRFCIYPSLYEGFGLPITEAIASGTRAIASMTSSMPEAGGDWAEYVDPSSTDHMVSVINQLIEEGEDDRTRQISGGKQWVNHTFSMKKYGESIINCYRGLI